MWEFVCTIRFSVKACSKICHEYISSQSKGRQFSVGEQVINDGDCVFEKEVGDQFQFAKTFLTMPKLRQA